MMSPHACVVEGLTDDGFASTCGGHSAPLHRVKLGSAGQATRLWSALCTPVALHMMSNSAPAVHASVCGEDPTVGRQGKRFGCVGLGLLTLNLALMHRMPDTLRGTDIVRMLVAVHPSEEHRGCVVGRGGILGRPRATKVVREGAEGAVANSAAVGCGVFPLRWVHVCVV